MKLQELHRQHTRALAQQRRTADHGGMIPRLIIAGSRTITDPEILRAALAAYHATPERVQEVVSGGAKGADALGAAWAREHGIRLQIFVADWAAFGKSAGPRRNTAMARYATHLLALWDGQSRGTKHMIDCARSQGLRVYVYRVAFES